MQGSALVAAGVMSELIEERLTAFPPPARPLRCLSDAAVDGDFDDAASPQEAPTDHPGGNSSDRSPRGRRSYRLGSRACALAEPAHSRLLGLHSRPRRGPREQLLPI